QLRAETPRTEPRDRGPDRLPRPGTRSHPHARPARAVAARLSGRSPWLSLPPCGGGSGWGVRAPDTELLLRPTLTLPHKGGGNKASARTSVIDRGKQSGPGSAPGPGHGKESPDRSLGRLQPAAVDLAGAEDVEAHRREGGQVRVVEDELH